MKRWDDNLLSLNIHKLGKKRNGKLSKHSERSSMPRYINGHLQKVKSTSLQEIEPQSSDCFLPYATLFHPLYRNITSLSRSIINGSHNHFTYI